MKVCPKCKRSLSASDFYKNSARSDGLQSTCKSCKKNYQKDWYQRSSASQIERAKVNKIKVRNWIRQQKAKPCVDCKGSYPYYVMDFDHLTDKKFNINNSHSQYGLSRIKKEIAKCELVCSNCHRIRTHKRACNSTVE